MAAYSRRAVASPAQFSVALCLAAFVVALTAAAADLNAGDLDSSTSVLEIVPDTEQEQERGRDIVYSVKVANGKFEAHPRSTATMSASKDKETAIGFPSKVSGCLVCLHMLALRESCRRGQSASLAR